jgi:hypothetical protein
MPQQDGDGAGVPYRAKKANPAAGVGQWESFSFFAGKRYDRSCR